MRKTSSTARLIAHSLAWLAADDVRGAFIERETAMLSQMFARSVNDNGGFMWRALSARGARSLVDTLETALLPGIQLHYALRKLYIEHTTRMLLAQGIRQVVVLACGFDALAVRLSREFPDVKFIELDSASVMQAKTKALQANNLRQANLALLTTDFAVEPLVSVLQRSRRFDARVPSLFIAEGLLMYLTAPQVAALFAAVKRGGAPQSHFVFTFMEAHGDERIKFQGASRVIDCWLRRRGESFKSGFTLEGLADFLLQYDFTARTLVGADELRSRYLAAPHTSRLPLAVGEYICHAETLPKRL